MRRVVAAALAAASLTGCSQVEAAKPAASRPVKEARPQEKLTLEEVRQKTRALFRRADANGDNVVLEAELKPLRRHEKRELRVLDVEHDHRLTFTEAEFMTEMRYRRRDTNGDGVLTGRELDWDADGRPARRLMVDTF